MSPSMNRWVVSMDRWPARPERHASSPSPAGAARRMGNEGPASAVRRAAVDTGLRAEVHEPVEDAVGLQRAAAGGPDCGVRIARPDPKRDERCALLRVIGIDRRTHTFAIEFLIFDGSADRAVRGNNQAPIEADDLARPKSSPYREQDRDGRRELAGWLDLCARANARRTTADERIFACLLPSRSPHMPARSPLFAPRLHRLKPGRPDSAIRANRTSSR